MLKLNGMLKFLMADGKKLLLYPEILYLGQSVLFKKIIFSRFVLGGKAVKFVG